VRLERVFKFDVTYRLFVRKVDVAEPRLVAKSGAVTAALKVLVVDVVTEFTEVVEVI
jgi:hypothetical protein